MIFPVDQGPAWPLRVLAPTRIGLETGTPQPTVELKGSLGEGPSDVSDGTYGETRSLVPGCLFVPLFLFVFFIIIFGTIVRGIGLGGLFSVLLFFFFFSFLF